MSNQNETPSQERETKTDMPLQFDVSLRMVPPSKNLLAFANVTINGCFTVADFKVLNGENGLFIGMPSKPDQTSKTGYRDIVRPLTKEFRSDLTEAIVTAYHGEIEKLQAHIAAVAPTHDKPSIKKQLESGAKQASQEKTAPPNPSKGKMKSAER